MKNAKKPPPGIEREEAWKLRRVEQLSAAIGRAADSGKLTIAVADWAMELGRLVEDLAPMDVDELAKR